MVNSDVVKLSLRVVAEILVTVLVYVGVLILHKQEPYHRGFFANDNSIKYPKLQASVSDVWVGFYAISVPAAAILVVELVRGLRHRERRSGPLGIPSVIQYLYRYLGITAFGYAVTLMVTEVAKMSIGRLRPHFLQVCTVDLTTLPADTYITAYVCSTTNLEDLKDARMSFFSGHSSSAMYGATLASLYLYQRLRFPMMSLLRPLLQAAAITVAFYIGYTRIFEYYHHPGDVLTGFVVGALIAVGTFFMVDASYPDNIDDSGSSFDITRQKSSSAI